MAIKIKKSNEVRFYLYVSDAKVNMLFEQMFSVTTKTSRREFELGSGWIRGSSSVETDDEELDRDDKLRAVERALIDRDLVGTPQSPKQYFKGILPMRWGLYNDLETRPEGCPPLVYFGGVDPTMPLIVGLGGSSVHVLGHSGATSTYSRSATPTLVKWLVKGLYSEDDDFTPQSKRNTWIDDDPYEAVAVALHYLKPPTQQLQFLAKTLAVGTCSSEHMTGFPRSIVVLGTPLYVEHADAQTETVGFGLDEEWKQYFSSKKGTT